MRERTWLHLPHRLATEIKVKLKREGDPSHPTSNAKSEVPSKAKDFIKERAVAVLAREE